MVLPLGGMVAVLHGRSGSLETQPAPAASPAGFKYRKLCSGSPGSSSLICPPSSDARLSRLTRHLLDTCPPKVRFAYGEVCVGPWQLAQWFDCDSNSGRTLVWNSPVSLTSGGQSSVTVPPVCLRIASAMSISLHDCLRSCVYFCIAAASLVMPLATRYFSQTLSIQ